MKILGIIPARYASTRFPGKPLALIEGKPMVQHVYERTCSSGAVDHTIVATDDERIANCVLSFGGKVMMTSDKHRSGTDRCSEVVSSLGEQGAQYDVIINIQGDEPFVDSSQLQTLADVFRHDANTQIATLKKEITDLDLLLSPNSVKVICNQHGQALYFSRQPLPYIRNVESAQWLQHNTFYKHIGIYAFRRDTLLKVAALPQSPLELCESLEQLRWIENGLPIAVRETTVENASIDTLEDLQELINKLRQ